MRESRKITEYSKTNLSWSFVNVQNNNDFSVKTLELIEWLWIYLKVKLNPDLSYYGLIETENPGISLDDIKKIINKTEWKKPILKKTIFINEVHKDVRKLTDNFIKMGLKTANSLSFEEISLDDDLEFWNDLEEIDLTDWEKEAMWLDTTNDSLEKAFESEKDISMKDLWIKQRHIREEFFNTSQWTYEIHMKSLLQFPLLDWIHISVSPNLYIPHVYTVHAQLKDWQVFYIYKWVVNNKTLTTLYKKAKLLNITEARNDDWTMELQKFLAEIIKNPYFNMNPSIIKAINHSHCRFCWSESIYEETYKGPILALEVWEESAPKIVDPLEIEDFWEISEVNCAACKKPLLTSEDRKYKEVDAQKLFTDFECPICKTNAFKSSKREKIKVKVDFATIVRRYSPDNKMVYSMAIKWIWWMHEVYCNKKWCNWAKYM